MDQKTGETILKILTKRVPFHATSVTCFDGTVLAAHSIHGIGRDLGAVFDGFWINGEEDGAEFPQYLTTADIWRISDGETGAVIFDADVSAKA